MSGRGNSSRGVGGRGGARGGSRGRGGGGGGGGRGNDRGGRGGRGGFGGGANAFVVKPSYNYVAEYSDEVSQADSMPLISKLPAPQPKKNKNLSECTIMLRPGYGTLGTKTNVGTNFVDYKIVNLTFYSYFVTFPKELETKRKVRAELMEMLLDKAPFKSTKKTISHNNSDTFYSTVPIPIEDSKDKKVLFTFTDEELKGVVPGPKRGEKPRSGPFAVTVEFIHKLDMNDLQKSVSLIGDNRLEAGPYINALNVSLGYQISKSKNVYSVGTNRFFFVDKPQASQSFQKGLYLVNGFFASIVPTFNNIVINVNSAAGAFIKSHNKDGTPMSVADLVGDYFGTENLANLDPNQLMRHKSFFKGIKITRDYLGHAPRPKSLHDIDTRVTSNNQKFDVDGKEMSVAQYFKLKYKITLKYPNLPLIHMGGTNYTPMEVCTVCPGQQFTGDITDVKGMLDFTTHRPPAISGLIQKEGLKIIAKGDPESRIGKKLMVVPSRVLDPVVVQYANGNVSYVPKPFDGKSEDAKGSWNLNGRKFYRGVAKPLNLLVVALEEASRPMRVEQRDLCNRAITAFVSESNKYGIKYNKDYLLKKVVIKNPHELERELEDLARAQKGKSGFILWLLPQQDKSLYSSVKKVCDVRVGIPNQCAVFSKFTKERFGKFDLSMYGLMGMKSCIKLGGVNHVLHDEYSKLLMKNNLPTLLLGADVSHPTGAGAGNGTDIAPSITSVVGSVDGFFNTFPGSISYQTGKVEMIADMEKMCIERILAYHKKVGKLPQDVIFYRDGVSEGQFDLLLKNEVPFVKAAFTKIKNKFNVPNYSPKLTFVIIVKRHNTRFFPLNKDAKAPSGKQIAVQAKENIIAGSIVDKGITSVKYYDFYLQSQQALQGTAVPGHYYVLYDEANYKPDEIQKITYGLCNIFARATKSVRVVPPAYYADLLCERGSCYFNGVQGSRSKSLLQAAKEMYPGTHRDVVDTMIYI